MHSKRCLVGKTSLETRWALTWEEQVLEGAWPCRPRLPTAPRAAASPAPCQFSHLPSPSLSLMSSSRWWAWKEFGLLISKLTSLLKVFLFFHFGSERTNVCFFSVRRKSRTPGKGQSSPGQGHANKNRKSSLRRIQPLFAWLDAHHWAGFWSWGDKFYVIKTEGVAKPVSWQLKSTVFCRKSLRIPGLGPTSREAPRGSQCAAHLCLCFAAGEMTVFTLGFAANLAGSSNWTKGTMGLGCSLNHWGGHSQPKTGKKQT